MINLLTFNNSFSLPRHSLKLVGVSLTTAISYDTGSLARTTKCLEQVEQGLENLARPLKRDFKIQRRGRQRERQKNNSFYKQNNNFARASRFFVHFFAHFCTTTTWKCLISFAFYGGHEQATTKFYSPFWTWIWPLGIQFQERSPKLTK